MKRNVLMMIAMVVLFFSSAESQTTINESIIAFNDYTLENQNTQDYKIDDTSKAEAFNHSIWDELLQKHVNDKGNVNYKGFIQDREPFESYLAQLANKIPQDNWTREDKLAYWINVYNAFTVKLIIDNYPVKSIRSIGAPWGKRFFSLGGEKYNLNEVEHKILRKMGEPRIHFAIVCASISCPKLKNKAYTANDLEAQLTSATKEFLTDETKNNLTENKVKISKIFRWFDKDFKQNNQTIISFINKYVPIDIAEDAKISFNSYDWKLNE